MTGPAAIEIRAFRGTDQAAVKALVLAGLKDHFGTIDPALNPDLNDVMKSYVARGAVVVVAEWDGRLVGTGTLMPERPGVGRLVRVSVDRSCRGQGLGRRLVHHLLGAARGLGLRRVLVETTEDWQDAIGLYRACGFADDGVRDGDIHLSLDLS
ncbi:MAG: GNAT family N-acetyltransferase [Thermomicrobiales bacterium]